MIRIAFVTFIISVGLATDAFAEDRKAAERYFRAGAKAYSAQNFGAAAQNFDEAYRAAPMPEIAFSAAQAYRRLYRIDPRPEHVQRAVELYKAYLAVVKTGGRVGDAADNLAEMQRELDRLNIRTTVVAAAAPKTRVGVSITLTDQRAGEGEALREIGDATGQALAPNLKATLDGQPIEPFALIDVEPKEHVITVSADGYLPVEKKTVAVDGISQLVEVELQPKPAQLMVRTEDGARISVDGRAVATTPTGAVQLAAGRHYITVLRNGREAYGTELVVARGETRTLEAPLEKTAKRKAVPWVLGGAGLLAAGAITTGILTGVHDGTARDLRADIDAGDQPQSVRAEYEREVGKRDDFRTAAWVLGGAAIATGAVGVLLYMFDEPRAEGIRVAPVAGPGTAGAALSGRF